jgi:hypothetical protein
MKIVSGLILFTAFFLISASPTVFKKKKDKNRFQSSVITLQKTECYGTCPVYTITIYGTGKVLFEGVKHVKKEGKFQKQLKPSEVNKLFNAFECANFSDFKNEYDEERISDLPTTYISFEHRGFKKRIKDYYNAPEELKKLEKLVEDIAMNEQGWEKI